MPKSSSSSNILVVLQLVALLEEARSGDPVAQLEAISEILQLLTTRIAYLRNNPVFAKALIDQIAKEISKHTATPALAPAAPAVPEGV